MKPLLKYKRKNITEITQYGSVVWVHGRKTIYQYGPNLLLFGRSLLKPYQMKVFSQDFKDSLSLKQKAISLSSHNGEDVHLKLAQSLLGKKYFQYLKTPSQHPLKKRYEVKKPTSWHHPCSGKHSAILKGCQIRGWSLENYLSTKHPYHKAFINELKKVLGKDWTPQTVAPDGCGLPAPCFFINELGILFSQLALNKKEDWVWKAMTKHPNLIGGSHRIDSEIMKNTKGVVLAKGGADGLLGLSLINKKYPQGLGVIVKLSQGHNEDSLRWITNHILKSLNQHSISTPVLKTQKAFVSEKISPQKTIANIYDISPEISSKTAVYPGDISFQRKVSLDCKKNDPLTLSSVHTTLHIGAHVDSPSHYHPLGEGIHRSPLKTYLGACQVVEVKKQSSSRIYPEDMKNKAIKASRILFKTNSFKNPNKWTNHFNSLSPELIEFLFAKQVELVGIDTPSIDPWDSKALESHNKVYEKNMSILEGIVLTHINEGIYTLIALPLKI